MLQLFLASDHTGSCSSILTEVKRKSKHLYETLFKDLPGSTVSLCAFNNYEDSVKDRVYSMPDFYGQDQEAKLNGFLEMNKRVGGGYSTGFKGNSCSAVYELALKHANTLAWRDDMAKAVVLIGDEEPSALSYGVDWRQEVNALNDKGVKIYGVQCLGKRNQYFYDQISQATGGVRLNLDQFQDIIELLLAISYKERGDESLEDFAARLKAESKMSRSLLSIFDSLSSGAVGQKLQLSFTDYSKVSDKDLIPVDPYRFQVLNVDKNQDIKSFVLETGARFKTGAGFYELSKREEIQERKEVVLQEKASGDMWSGEAARNMIGLPLGQRGNIGPRGLPNALKDKFTVYVQSTSNNRKLIGGSKFLYEVDLT